MVSIKREVALKFPQQDNAVIVVWFLRFLCPAILQPHVYGVTEGFSLFVTFILFIYHMKSIASTF
jgi:hypothetical protein